MFCFVSDCCEPLPLSPSKLYPMSITQKLPMCKKGDVPAPDIGRLLYGDSVSKSPKQNGLHVWFYCRSSWILPLFFFLTWTPPAQFHITLAFQTLKKKEKHPDWYTISQKPDQILAKNKIIHFKPAFFPSSGFWSYILYYLSLGRGLLCQWWLYNRSERIQSW